MSEQNPTRTFTLFPNLPSERQLKIWEHAAVSSARTIVITSADSTIRDENGDPTTVYQVTHNPPRVPNLLETCYDSRKIALEEYELAFGAQFSGRPIYFNFDGDILFFKDCHAFKSRFGGRHATGWIGFTGDEKKLKVIAIGGKPGEFDEGTLNLWTVIWGLEKLILQEPEENRRIETRELLRHTWRTCKEMSG
jgi:hypothetical protein